MTDQSQKLWLFAMLAVSVVLRWDPLVNTFRLALVSEAHTQILIVIPLSCALALMQRKVRSNIPESSRSVGYCLLALALIVGVGADFEGLRYFYLTLSIFALVTWWIGSLIACSGISRLRTHLFPLLFLYWLVPLPDFVVDKIISVLQILSAYAARFLLVIGQIPVTQDRTLLSMRGFDVDVAPQCSSIRSSLMLMITTMVFAHLFLRSWQRKTILIAAAIPMAALKNGLRIFTLVAIGTRYDPGIFDSDLHHRGGIVFFLISVMMTFALLWIVRRTEEAGHANAEGRDKHQLMQSRP